MLVVLESVWDCVKELKKCFFFLLKKPHQAKIGPFGKKLKKHFFALKK